MGPRDTLAGVVRERGGWPRSAPSRLPLFLAARPTGRIHLEATPMAGAGATAPRVDRATGILHGVSCMQAGEAKGHGVMIDQVTLSQCAAAINAASKGLKSRLGHPPRKGAGDAIGSQMGRVKGPAQIAGDRVLADLHLSKASANSPKGDLRTWAMDTAEEDPESIGLSAVTDEAYRAWKLADGSEIDARDESLASVDEESGKEVYVRPHNAVGELPVLRIKKLAAMDMVDDPAANREGLFEAMDEVHTPSPKTSPTVKPSKESAMLTLATLRTIKADFSEFAAEAIDLAEGGADEATIRTKLSAKRTDALRAQVEELKAKATKDAEALAAKDAELAKEKAAHKKLAELKAGIGSDPGGLSTSEEGVELSTDERIKKEWKSDLKLQAEWKKVGLGYEEYAAGRRVELGGGFGSAPTARTDADEDRVPADKSQD